RDDFAADRGLDGDLEEVRRDDGGEALAEVLALAVRLLDVDDGGERVDGLAVDEDVHLHELRLAVLADLVVHRAVAAGDALEAVVEVDEDLVERQDTYEDEARLVERLGVLADAALLHDEV